MPAEPSQSADVPAPREQARIAEELGLDPCASKKPHHLAAAIEERRKLIAAMDHEAMLDVLRWSRRNIPPNADNERLAKEIVAVKAMRFAGLSHRGLVILAEMRGLSASPSDTPAVLIRRLQKQENWRARFWRKRRTALAAMAARLLGPDETSSSLDSPAPPPSPTDGPRPLPPPAPPRIELIQEELEEAGLFGGIANRLRKHADVYLNQKLDEIETRIDRKLDEIDRRLADWRDREIANRLRILKITLWASVIVALVSLIYDYIMTYRPH